VFIPGRNMKKIIAIAFIGIMSFTSVTTLLAEDVVKYDKPKTEKPVFKPNHPSTDLYLYGR
jgi:hypothetical protein